MYLKLIGLGTAAVTALFGLSWSSGAWYYYGELTPASLLHIAQDITQPPLESVQPAVPLPSPTEPVSSDRSGQILPPPPPLSPTPPPPQSEPRPEYQQLQPMPQPMPRPKYEQRQFEPRPEYQQPRTESRPEYQQPRPQPRPAPERQQPPESRPRPEFEQQDRQGIERRMPSTDSEENQFLETENEEFEQPSVDPREIRQVLRDITQMQRELQRFAKLLSKTPAANQGDVELVNQLRSKLAEFRTSLQSSDQEVLRETLQEFRDENYWELINELRIRVEMPQTIVRMEKELNRLSKMAGSPAQTKYLRSIGLDLTKVTAYVADYNTLLAQMKNLLQSGDYEGLSSLLEDTHDQVQPGEMTSIMSRFNELNRQFGKVRNEEIKNQIRNALPNIVSEFNAGNYQEAREMLNQLFGNLQKIWYGGVNNGRNAPRPSTPKPSAPKPNSQ